MLSIDSARYLASYHDYAALAKPTYPEIAFIGRSNVGKSSLINFICNHKALAKTSRTPGKTRYFNFFLINDTWCLVDLPGYGYAKVSYKERNRWQTNLQSYLDKRGNLKLVCLLVDSSIPPQSVDFTMITNLLRRQIPMVLIFTKIDKNKPLAIRHNIENFLKELPFVPPYIQVSVRKHIGHKELLELLDKYLA